MAFGSEQKALRLGGLFHLAIKDVNGSAVEEVKARSCHVVQIVLIYVFLATCMLRTLTRFRKVAVRGLEHGILIPMSQLALHRGVSGLCALVLFYSPFFAILILILQTSHE